MAAHHHDHWFLDEYSYCECGLHYWQVAAWDAWEEPLTPEQAERVLVQELEELVERLGDERTSRAARIILADRLRASASGLWAILSYPPVTERVP
jgi:hypothetical protein